ncbi:hypothetical protein [Leptothoe spongobia]|uniref:Uncharacterized protein n=1 Tax=Leptothoe spongobia TAU-MAC 1115 TaxID=1967444 RepID=A0A947DEU0_9CYAN|nr:hypothetical protein [Leptothoe spongobia]MBT9315620.1 hypothetical protein [Leptothoe spongobia TAU-MAC 1115]
MGTDSINAVIDIGTNSLLLLVAQKVTGTSCLSSNQSWLIPLSNQAHTVRLGENLAATGCLSDGILL